MLPSLLLFPFPHVGSGIRSVLTPDWWLMAAPRLEASKDCDMKKKLLVLLIAVIPSLMPNLASAVAIDMGDIGDFCGYSARQGIEC